MKLKTLNLHLTNRCNLRCRHCLYSSGEKVFGEMSYKELNRIIEEFALISDSKGTLNMFGGEVFLRGDIFKLIDLAVSKNLKIGITTNVNLPQKIIKRISHTGISRVTVDIDGASALNHEWLRRKSGHFKQSLDAIKLFLRAGKFTTVNVVLHKKNADEIEKILNLCQQTGINVVSFYLFTQLGRGRDIEELVIGPVKWKSLRQRVKRWLNNNKPTFGVIWERSYDYRREVKHLPSALCQGRPSDVIDVRCDGDVFYCGLLSATNSLSLGNVKKDTLAHILKMRTKCSSPIKVGCSALAFNGNSHKPKDPRMSTKTIIPVCPYDWELLYGSVRNLRPKFAHIDA